MHVEARDACLVSLLLHVSFSEVISHLDLELTDWLMWLASKHSNWSVFLSLVLQLQATLIDFYVDTGDANSDFNATIASTNPLSHLPSPKKNPF